MYLGLAGTDFEITLPILPGVHGTVIVPGLDMFYALDENNRKTMKDIYGTTIPVVPPPVVDSPEMYVLKGYVDGGYSES